ncbi:hypothetical protein [Arthrobacter sp. UYEF36]|uniref:hypothetical protein n=1 Tax=Arthrobacter sp. UYEF36 TaxID=1756366 RepID=UPI00339214D0
MGDNFINCVQAGRMGEWGRGEADAHRGQVRRAPVAIVVLCVAQVVTVLMIIGGLGLVVWMQLWLQEVIAAYPVGPDNDVTRGFFIGMAGGLGIAGLSVIALVGLTRGRRWGGLVDVVQWAVIWLPFAFGLSQFSPDAYAIATAISLAGALVGALAFFTARRGRLPEAGPA